MATTKSEMEKNKQQLMERFETLTLITQRAKNDLASDNIDTKALCSGAQYLLDETQRVKFKLEQIAIFLERD